MREKTCSECGRAFGARSETITVCSRECKRARDTRLARARRRSSVAGGGGAGGPPPSRPAPRPPPDPPPPIPDLPFQDPTIRSIVLELRALLDLPHVEAVTVHRDGRMTVLRAMPHGAEIINVRYNPDAPSFEVR